MHAHNPQVHIFCSICWVHHFKSTSYPYAGLSCLFLMCFRFTKLLIITSWFTSFSGSSETFVRAGAPTEWPRRHLESLSVHGLLAPTFWESVFDRMLTPRVQGPHSENIALSIARFPPCLFCSLLSISHLLVLYWYCLVFGLFSDVWGPIYIS